MDVSLLVSLLVGLPAAVLATLRIIDWWKKRRARKPRVPDEQGFVPIIRQAEMAVDIEGEIAEELRYNEAEHRCQVRTQLLTISVPDFFIVMHLEACYITDIILGWTLQDDA